MSELNTINHMTDYELVQYMQNGIIDIATGGMFSEYQIARSKLFQNNKINHLLPSWLKTCRDGSQFWSFIKVKFAHYQERREFIWQEFSKVLNFLEPSSTTPIIENTKFDEDHIHQQWQKAIERKNTDPDGAITIARTLIESLLKYILNEKKIEFNESADLPELYKLTSKSLNMAPEQHQEQVFKQILSGVSNVIIGLGTMRNKLGDAHGKSKTQIKPKERHSEFAVNLAGATAVFLYKTFKENR